MPVFYWDEKHLSGIKNRVYKWYVLDQWILFIIDTFSVYPTGVR
jgi:hypothetical protein